MLRCFRRRALGGRSIRATFAHNRGEWVGWAADPKKEGLMRDWGLNEGLRCVSCSNLQVLRCHPCACKLFCISFPLNS